MAMSLTLKQLDCARVIAELTTVLGRAPSMSEIANELDALPGEAYRLVDGLAERGWLPQRAKDEARDLTLLHEPPPIEECRIELTDHGRAFLAEAGIQGARS